MTNYLIRRNPTSTFDLLEGALNSFFKPTFFEEKYDSMKTDIKETETAYLMDVEMPGFDKTDISLSLEKGYLTLSAEKKETVSENENFLRRERSRSLSRTYYVGDVDKDAVKAKYENGILQIEIPKKEKELPKTHQIAID